MTFWKETAKEMYFKEHRKIVDIAAALGKRRETVSRALAATGQRDQERAFRRARGRRRGLETLCGQYEISAESLRREHDQAALILSREKI